MRGGTNGAVSGRTGRRADIGDGAIPTVLSGIFDVEPLVVSVATLAPPGDMRGMCRKLVAWLSYDGADAYCATGTIATAKVSTAASMRPTTIVLC